MEGRMKRIPVMVVAGLVLAAGCSDNSSGPDNQTNSPLVVLTASAGGSAGGVFLSKIAGADGVLSAVDSLSVDHAVVVLKDLRFIGVPDTAHMRDSVECERDNVVEDHGKFTMDSTRHFRGPFVITLLDTTPVQIALDTIRPGAYAGIRFNIHKLRQMDVQRNPLLPDSLVQYSIAVAGMVKYTGGVWTPYLFKADVDEDFLVKGDFVITAGQQLTPYVLKFDIVSWFRSSGGRILDPNSSSDRTAIRNAIKGSLKGHMRGGRDRDHNGEPDFH
jgi:hypothetical protein